MSDRVPLQDIVDEAAARRERIKGYMTQDPPIPFKQIIAMEGLDYRSGRIIARQLEKEHNITYFKLKLREPVTTVPHGITPRTLRLRQKLGDNLYMLVNRGAEGNKLHKNVVAPKVGLNGREQRRAQQRPFNHDWKLSQIERLAQELNRDPVEFMLSCLTS